MPRKVIHKRTVIIEVYDEGDGTMTFEGKLEDLQPEDSGYFKARFRENDPRPPGVLHGMSANFRVDRSNGEIVRTAGDFPHTPNDGCDAVVGWLSKLDGLQIGNGYNAKAREALGGPRGCAHMNTLLQVLANTKTTAGAYFMPQDKTAWLSQSKSLIEKRGRLPNVDSCHMWRKDGPIEQSIVEQIEAAEAEGRI